MIQGFSSIFSTVEDFNKSDRFKSGISKCFRDIGLAPINSRGDFVRYPTTHSKSKISIGKDVMEKKGQFNPYAILLQDDFAFEHKEWNDGAADALLGESDVRHSNKNPVRRTTTSVGAGEMSRHKTNGWDSTLSPVAGIMS